MRMKLIEKLARFSGLRKARFNRQLTFVFAGGMIVLALLSSYATYTLTERFLHERLIEEGMQATKAFAGQSALALLYQSPDNATEAAEMTLATPDVLGVGIYLTDREPLLEMGYIRDAPQEIPELGVGEVDMVETDSGWYYTRAVYSGTEAQEQDSPFVTDVPEPELLGFVKVAVSKQSLIEMTGNVLKGNFAVSMVLAAVLLVFLLLITKRLVRPLGDLAELMLKAEQGEPVGRADIHGPKDIADMQHAFNSMMDVLDAREEELVTARDMAVESARVKGQFAANVTHELRTPLNGIIGMLQLLDNPSLDEEQRRRVNSAQSSAEALMALINDILDFSKIDAGKAAPQVQSFELDTLITDVVDLLRNQAANKGIYLRHSLDEDVPRSVYGEPTRIRQVLFNLVGNAIKFTGTGGVEIKVTLTAAGTPNAGDRQAQVRFSVTDTGVGIPEEAQERIFDAFSQADGSTSRTYGGTGLGLTISRQLVDYMGGQVGLTSATGEGACFWFEIPLELSEEPTGPARSDRRADAPLPPLPKGTRVLIVDDNVTNQQVAQGMLQNLGCKTAIAESGDTALQMILGERYDAVLMDVQMPGMDGYEVTDQVRRLEDQDTHLPIIAMTANNQQSDIDHCLAVGMDDFLPKPFKRDTLHRILHHCLGEPESDQAPAPGHPVREESGAEAAADRTAPTGAPEPVDQTLDKSVLQELQENAGHAYLEMIEVYLDDQWGHVEAIVEAIKATDRETLKHSAHTLKGSSRHFGAEKLGRLCESIEQAADGEPMDRIEPYIEPLEMQAKAVRRALNNELDKLKFTDTARFDPVQTTTATVLVVDDDRSMRVTMRAILERDGYTIVECSNGAQALKYCEESPPGLILMDAMMPGLDGFSACRALRNNPETRQIPVLVVTALDDDNSIDRAFAAGANDFIPKPVNFAVLRQRISRLLEASLAEKHVRHLAFHDTLTGLPNRRTFTEQLQLLIAEPHDETDMIAVLFLDLDRFKLVNDSLGHDAGDTLLKAATSRIQNTLRRSDMVSRMGGDEFTVILDHMKSADVVGRIARKICDELSRPFDLEGQQVYVTTSIGIAMYPGDTTEVATLIKFADTAMFQAKELRNTFQFYEPGMETMVAKRMELETEMRKALERNEFTLHYQPQIDIQTCEVVGMEALVRWRHPDKGMVSPADFIPLAEETGLIAPLGQWVLKNACLQLREWLDKGYPPAVMAVNISSRQLEDPAFLNSVIDILRETGVPPGYVELEITESAIMKYPEKVIPALEGVKEHGIGLAIDDFGTGQSSLNYLRRFPVDTLKIDRHFVNDISKDTDDTILVDSIIALAKSLHLKVIAEGVESQEQLNYLKMKQCNWVQGFYLFKPMPADQFEEQVFRKRTAMNF